MYIMDGKETSKELKEEIKQQVKGLPSKPKLLVILVGDDPASKVYVASKEKASRNCGIDAQTIVLDGNVSQKEIIDCIEKANKDKSINAILVQLPLPDHINTKAVIEAIDPLKDVDGLTSLNQGKLFLGLNGIVPCTPKGIMHLFDKYNVDLTGKNAIVIGRSLLVGKPLSMLMLAKNATVTIAHSKTKNLKELCLGMDVIVSAVGKPKMITADMVKEGAIVIDVGINRVHNTLVGDVDYLSVCDKCARITPVPGGVGPMTIACLLENVVECYKMQMENK
ncbi:MAG: bifunctional 5,10-methylenetetrahydrofolate dehydrogenase/5,10-methenyltetrahydrofolate cyclohydrolase [Bacilli bacterium]|nr:bifunctional 5,10-methylenetetrahydrofolate dehydrogenase/5,10-methenyltetrahydrofolate cyclohydrolase [Bacilli bacterium]